jgi:hypothetical protein
MEKDSLRYPQNRPSFTGTDTIGHLRPIGFMVLRCPWNDVVCPR